MSDLVSTALELVLWFKDKAHALRENDEKCTYLMQRFLLMEPKLAEFDRMSIKSADKAILRSVIDVFQEGKAFVTKYTEKTYWRGACRFLQSGEYAGTFDQISGKLDVCLSQLHLSHSLSSEERRQQDMQDMKLYFAALSRQLVADVQDNRPGNSNEESLAEFRAMMSESSGLINHMLQEIGHDSLRLDEISALTTSTNRMVQSLEGQLQEIDTRLHNIEAGVQSTGSEVHSIGSEVHSIGSEVHDLHSIFNRLAHDNNDTTLDNDILDWLRRQGLKDSVMRRLIAVFFAEGIDDLSRLLRAVRSHSSTPGGFRSWIMSRGAEELDIDDLDISEAALEQEIQMREPRTITGIFDGCEWTYTGQVSNGQPHGSGTRTFTSGERSGNVYVGEFKQGVCEGRAKYTWPSGHVYDGEWKEGLRSGRGKMTFADGEVYDGEWKEDQMSGRGKMTSADGEVYDGEWEEDQMSGRGKYTYIDGAVYDGEWKEDKTSGGGKYTFADGEVYDGEFKEGKRSGRGMCTFADGDVYDGEWKEDKKSGRGEYTFADGEVYDGEWKEGKRSGRGMCTFADGDVYDGEWKEGERSGRGKSTYADGAVYDGEWKEGKRSGRGKCTYASGDVYDGEWKEGVRSGTKTDGVADSIEDLEVSVANCPEDVTRQIQTELHSLAHPRREEAEAENARKTEAAQEKPAPAPAPKPAPAPYSTISGTSAGCGWTYTGQVSNGQPHGSGTRTFTSGAMRGDVYVGEFKRGKTSGRGKMTYADGQVYDGEWKVDERSGRGKQTWPSGQVYDGEWKEDQKSGMGKQTFADGRVYHDGEWKHSKPVK